MSVFDSELTCEGTQRKKIYIVGGGKKAKRQAMLDITEYNKTLKVEKQIKPYKGVKFNVGNEFWIYEERKKLGLEIKPINKKRKTESQRVWKKNHVKSLKAQAQKAFELKEVFDGVSVKDINKATERLFGFKFIVNFDNFRENQKGC